MKINNKNISIDDQISEFDFWVTPSITDIRQTDRFKLEMERIKSVLNLLVGLPSLKNSNVCAIRLSSDLTSYVLGHIDVSIKGENNQDKSIEIAGNFLLSFSALLFLVTGKSDNNNKCQLPIFLRNKLGWVGLYSLKSVRRKLTPFISLIPRVLSSESYMDQVARLYIVGKFNPALKFDDGLSLTQAAHVMLLRFVEILLSDKESAEQLNGLIDYYRERELAGKDPALLLVPSVVFQVRGSVAASGGHEPEELLRFKMTEWGMLRGIDYNNKDVILNLEAAGLVEIGDEGAPVGSKKKTRAYDFVLPYRTPSWTPRVFIQSQFYAGDSGSVSHKNVDQTEASRTNAKTLVASAWPNSPAPRFLEYVDGAGYSASLNGDLRSLLSFPDTAGFFQVRSAPVRLRRELQNIGFLTPLEVCHAILVTGGIEGDVRHKLQVEGYAASEIDRVLSMESEYIKWSEDGSKIVISSNKMSTVRQYLLLDILTLEGRYFSSSEASSGTILIPGFGPYYGVVISDLGRLTRKNAPGVWEADAYMDDLQSLCGYGYVVLK